MLVSCSKTGTKNVDKVNNEIKNSTSQFSLNTEELEEVEENVLRRDDQKRNENERVLRNGEYGRDNR